MRIVYITGPYMGTDYLSIDRNITRAREAAAWLANNGIGFFCPHMNSAHFEAITPDVPPDFWYELDLRFLDACDALLLIEGWEDSKGSRAEKEHAEKRGMPVFVFQHFFSLSGGDAFKEWAR